MKIPSIDLSERTLTDICDVFNEQMKQDISNPSKATSTLWDKPQAMYEIREKNRDFETQNSEDFIRHAIGKELKRIKMWYRVSDRRIAIDIAIEQSGDSDYTVEGNDRIWVDGITARFDAIFQKYKTNNDLFHSRWRRAVPIYIGLGLLVGGMVILLGETFAPVDSEGDSRLAVWIFLGGALSVFSIFGWAAAFALMFPSIETEFTRQRKYRKVLLAGMTFTLGSIVVGLLVNYLSAAFIQ